MLFCGFANDLGRVIGQGERDFTIAHLENCPREDLPPLRQRIQPARIDLRIARVAAVPARPCQKLANRSIDVYCRTQDDYETVTLWIGEKAMQKRSSLMVRLDEESKALLASAAELRKVSVSDYVRSIVVGQARRELAAAGTNVISMTPEEQMAFWQALSKPPKLTKAQKQLGKIMRCEA